MVNVLWVLCSVLVSGCTTTVERRSSVPQQAMASSKDAGVESVLDATPTQASATPLEGSGSVASASIYEMDSGHEVRVSPNLIVIYAASGREMSRNSNLIRGMDENGNCPSEGFIQIVTKGEYFTLEQQNCSGWHFIFEQITFKYSASTKQFSLHEIVLEYVDRRHPEKKEPREMYTSKALGNISFEEVRLDSLYDNRRGSK